MPQFLVTITYEVIDRPLKEEHLRNYDPSEYPDNPFSERRVYKSLVNARSDREAFKKVLSSRREVECEKRIYSDCVCHYTAIRFP